MILIIDDDLAGTASLALLLKQAGFASTAASTPDEAIDVLRRQPCQLVIQDMNFSRRTSGEEGLALLQRIKALTPALPVVLITAWGSINLAVEGMKAGAADFVTKPWTNQQMLETVKTTLGLAASRAAADEQVATRDDLDARFDFGNLVGRDPKMLRVLQLIGRVAPTQASVLITGESGTGKELVAEALHEHSPRARGPFVKLHCAALAETILESELFGHERGAFTGAAARRDGRFQQADGGTLFLDEIGEISPAIQVKLLRFLQERQFERVGGNETIKVDVRILAATNRDLARMVKEGHFREDLYYRLNVISIEMPSLRERPTDIPLLAMHFLRKFAGENEKPVASFADDALAAMTRYEWPGNVRELENAIERSVIICRGDTVRAGDLPAQVATAEKSVPTGGPVVPGATLAELEKYAILKTLELTGGSTSRAADILGISTRKVQYRLREYQGGAPAAGGAGDDGPASE
jgi:two-component system response regulator HydG